MSLKINTLTCLDEIATYMTKAVKQPRNGFKNHDSWFDLKDLVCHFENNNNFNYELRVKIWDNLNVFEMPKTKANILKLLSEIVEANKK